MANARTASKAVVPAKSALPIVEKISDEELAMMDGVQGGVSDNIEDRGVPLLYIAQKGSKQVNKKEVKFIKDLEVGDAFNNLTGEIFKAESEGVRFIPCFFRVVYNEWTPMDQGGGFHGSHPRDTPLVREGRAKEGRSDVIDMPSGTELVLTHMYYGIMLPSNEPIIVAMSSSNLSCSKIWQNMMNSQKAETTSGKIVTKPGFFNVYKLSTYYDKNDAGDWYRWKVEIDGPNSDVELREVCKEFAIGCQKNEVQASRPDADVGGSSVNVDGKI